MREAELDGLLNALLPFAQQMLEKHAGLVPFGAMLDADGRITQAMPQAASGAGESTGARVHLDGLVASFRHQHEQEGLRAVALCWDATMTKDGERVDAIAVGLEHSEGEAVNVYLPYTKRRFRGYAYGELIVGAREAVVFAD